MSRAQASHSADAGFTLAEMLVALAILGLAAAIALPRLTRPSDGLRLAAAARELTGTLRLTRTAAIAGNAERVWNLDVETRRFGPADMATRALPPDIRVELKVADPERLTPSRGGIRFFADGSSTGGEILLSLNARTVKLCVHWLTGQPLESAQC
jgi:general secretion pathway protein H